MTSMVNDVALILFGMGKVNAAKVISHFSESEAAIVSAAIQELDKTDAATVNRVLTTFFHDSEKEITQHATVFTTAEEKKTSVPEMDALNAQPDFVVAQLIANEHPQVIAVVLSQLEPQKAANILSRLPKTIQVAVIKRISSIGAVSRFALAEIEKIISERLKDAVVLKSFDQGGVEVSARIINFLDSDVKSELMTEMKLSDESLSQKITHNLFSLDRLMQLSSNDLAILMNKTSDKILAYALKGTDEVMSARLFEVMSSEKADAVKVQMQQFGYVQLSKIQDAQTQIVLLAQQLIKNGVIHSPKNDDVQQDQGAVQ